MIYLKYKSGQKIFGGVFLGFIISLSIWIILNLFVFSKNNLDNNIEYQENITGNYAVYAFPVPENVSFAGEKIPVENFDVKESLDKEILKVAYWHSELFLYLKRANRYFPMIEKILKENGVPDDFKYLAVAESGLENVVSPAGARGVWQFLKSTGKQYKLEITNEIDERYNLEKSTKAACNYLKNSYKTYKDWALVAASYNVGQGNLNKQIKKQQVHSYYDLLLNQETARYLYRTVALKLILSNPKNYGFRFRKQDLYPEIQTYNAVIDSSVSNITKLAKHFGTNYKMLKYFNPWLRKNKLTNPKKKVYVLKIPKKGARNKNYFKNTNNQDSIINK